MCGMHTVWEMTLSNCFVQKYCDQCNQKVTLKGNLHQHKQFVQDVDNYTCQQCNYKAISNSCLHKHEHFFHFLFQQLFFNLMGNSILFKNCGYPHFVDKFPNFQISKSTLCG